MESPENKSPKKELEEKKVVSELKNKVEEKKEESEGIIDAIKETTEEVTDAVSKKKEAIVSSMKEKKQDISESIDSGVKKTKRFFRRVLMGAFLLAVVVAGVYMLYASWTYSEGTRSGDLIKISKKGYIFKTYEGQLKLGGIDLTKEEGLSDTWEFSVKDEAIAQQLEKLQGEKVILRYKQVNKAMPWQGDTDYFIYAIEQ